MLGTAKVSTTGNSQAIRLPKPFRVNVSEMWITKNEATGEITLKPKPESDELEAFIAQLGAMPVTEEFLLPRDDASAQIRLRAGKREHLSLGHQPCQLLPATQLCEPRSKDDRGLARRGIARFR